MRYRALIVAAVLLWETGCIQLPEDERPGVTAGEAGAGDGGSITPLTGTPDAGNEACNGQDDDQDGVIDERLTPPLTDNQSGSCAGRTQRCDPARGWIHPDQGPGLAELGCDGRDDDCDGAVDEGFVERSTQCGPERCEASGVLRCVDGVQIDSCVQGEVLPFEDPCDGVDNDCDGMADEGAADGYCCLPGDDAPPCNGCGGGIFVPEGWVCAPAGAYQMGSPGGQTGQFYSEEPAHQVTLSRALLVMATEVTQGQWSGIFDGNPSTFGVGDPTYPVNHLNWYEALAYANALSEAQGYPACYRLDRCRGRIGVMRDVYQCAVYTFAGVDCIGYRLPTEAEWEYFARAGTQTAYSYGDDPDELDQYAWFNESVDRRSTHAVAQLTPNPWGLYDVHGNAFEWAQDLYGEYSAGAQVDPVHDQGSGRVLRGGCFQSPSYYARSGLRYALSPSTVDDRSSVRLVRLAVPSAGPTPIVFPE